MKTNSKIMFRRKLLCVAVASCFTITPVYANPLGASVVNGQAGFATLGSTLTVTNTPNAIINWQQFSIGAGEITRFVQQSASSTVLNRVVGQDPSQLLGSLLSNGRVFLINPNGILFGQGAVIDVAGLVASTLRLSDADFLARRLNFTDGVGAGSINNQGSITTPTGGNVYLIAPDISNSGIITSPQGEILLAAGHTVNLMDTANPNVQVTVGAPDTHAVNIGSLIARSGKVGIYGALIDQQGLVNADTAVAGANGKISLRASKDITLEPGSVTTASGMAGGVKSGGEIRIVADGTLNVRQSSEIHVDGGVDGGNGGFLELSGKQKIALNGIYTGRAQKDGYRGGKLLLDPLNIVICADPLSCTGSTDGTPPQMLATGTVAYNSSPSSTLYLKPNMNGTSGIPSWSNVSLAAIRDISVASAITDSDVAPGGSLTMNAGNDINVNANIGTSINARFNHDLTMQAGNNVNINANIYMGNQTLVVRSGTSTGDLGFSPYLFCGGCERSIFITPLTANPVTVEVQGAIELYTPASGAVSITGGNAGNNQDASVKVQGGTVLVDGGAVLIQGGSAHAAASYTVITATANAELSATNSLTIHAAGNVIVAGGNNSSGSYTEAYNGTATAEMNALLHGGTVDITTTGGGLVYVHGGSGSGGQARAYNGGVAKVVANAELSATNGLTITSAGGLTVAGGNGNCCSGRARAFGGGSATVDAHALLHAATIIYNPYNSYSSYNGVQVLGGSSARARVNGSGVATTTANAELSATGNVTITTLGGLTVAGGRNAQAEVSSGGSAVATVNANATLSADGNMTLNVSGDVSVAGGGFASAQAYGYGGGNNTAITHADAGIFATGGLLTINAANLTMDGGEGWANARYSGINTAETTANATMQAGTLDVTLTGSLTMYGGSGYYGASAYADSAGVNTATAQANALITVTGNTTLNIGGDLNLTGGKAYIGSYGTTTAQAIALIDPGTMTANITGDVYITGGSGGNRYVPINYNALAFAGIVNTGPINMTIGGATGLTLTGGAGGATYNGWTVPGTGIFADPTSPINITYSGGGMLNVVADPLLDSAFMMTFASPAGLSDAVIAALNFGAGETNGSIIFDWINETIRFGDEFGDENNDKPVCN